MCIEYRAVIFKFLVLNIRNAKYFKINDLFDKIRLLSFAGLAPSSPLRRSPPRTAPCSPFIRSDYVSSSPVHPVHSAAVSHSASAFMFPPPSLSVHSQQQPWMNPVPLHSTNSASNPWPQPMESARSGQSFLFSSLLVHSFFVQVCLAVTLRVCLPTCLLYPQATSFQPTSTAAWAFRWIACRLTLCT